MTDTEKKHFDYLNKYSYVFRLVANQNGLGIVIQSLYNGQYSYHLCYNNALLANLVITENDIAINIYKYFKMLSKRVTDAYISSFYEPDRFRFDEFSEYCEKLKREYDSLDSTEPVKQEPEEESESDRLKKENVELRMQIDELNKRLFNLFLRI